MQGVLFAAAVQLCCRCSTTRRVIQKRLAPLTFARSYAVVTGCDKQVQQPLNFVAGQRVDPDDKSKQFDLLAPATGLHLLLYFCVLFLLLPRTEPGSQATVTLTLSQGMLLVQWWSFEQIALSFFLHDNVELYPNYQGTDSTVRLYARQI